MSDASAKKSGNLDVTLATWTWLLFDAGLTPADDGVLAACGALREAGGGGAIDALGQRLVEALRARLGAGDPGYPEVLGCARALFEGVATDLGEAADREERIRAIRRYQFARKLPWIARIVDRAPNGEVGPRWVMVQQVEGTVRIMDPYPWDDVDEQVEMPVADFLVKWELAGCESIRIG